MKGFKKKSVKEKEKKDKEESKKNGKDDLILLMNFFQIMVGSIVVIKEIKDIIKIPVQVMIHIAILKINLKMLVGFWSLILMI